MHYLQRLKKDKVLKRLIAQQKTFTLRKERNLCLYLCQSIMSQQLSIKVALVFQNRFMALFGKSKPTAKEILAVPFAVLRGIGLSNAKATYIHNIAQFALVQGMETKTLNRMSDDEVKTYLTQIKGVGPWTVEMLLMFALGREDVFSWSDLGIQNAMRALYNIKTTDKKRFKQRLHQIAEPWAPYRTYACLHLWEWKDKL